MAQLTANLDPPHTFGVNSNDQFEEFPVQAAVDIFAGSAVSRDPSTGLARQAVKADVEFLGIAERQALNAAGAAGAVNVGVKSRGQFQVPVVGATALTDGGALVYLTDGNTYTLTAATNMQVGKVTRVLDTATTLCLVDFQSGVYHDQVTPIGS